MEYSLKAGDATTLKCTVAFKSTVHDEKQNVLNEYLHLQHQWEGDTDL